MFGANESTEGRLQRDATRKRLASGPGMARRAIGGRCEISSAFYCVEGLRVDRARLCLPQTARSASAANRKRAGDGARHICTNGPGDLRYLEMIASAARKASAQTVPFGL